MVHSWKAHKGGCRALVASADEDALLTAGAARAAAQGGDVVRCWWLADLQAGTCMHVCVCVGGGGGMTSSSLGCNCLNSWH